MATLITARHWAGLFPSDTAPKETASKKTNRPTADSFFSRVICSPKMAPSTLCYFHHLGYQECSLLPAHPSCQHAYHHICTRPSLYFIFCWPIILPASTPQPLPIPPASTSLTPICTCPSLASIPPHPFCHTSCQHQPITGSSLYTPIIIILLVIVMIRLLVLMTMLFVQGPIGSHPVHV